MSKERLDRPMMQAAEQLGLRDVRIVRKKRMAHPEVRGVLPGGTSVRQGFPGSSSDVRGLQNALCALRIKIRRMQGGADAR
jgi:hypothetical protein